MGAKSLDEIFDGNADEPSALSTPAESDSQQEAQAPAPEETPEQQAASDEGDSESQATGEDESGDRSPDGLKKALQAERKLRKENEKRAKEAAQRLSRLESQLDELRRQGQAEPETKPDPDAAMDEFLAGPPDWVNQRVQTVQQQLEQRILSERANLSEHVMRRQHDDYDEAREAFKEAADRNPWMWQPVLTSPFPAEVVYNEGKRLIDSSGERSAEMSEEIAKLQARIAELEGQPQQSAPAPAPPKTIPKPSIAGARGSGAGRPQPWAGPRSLDSIFGEGG